MQTEAMKTFLLVVFWLGITSLIIRIFEMAVRDWPYEREVSLGEQLAVTLIGITFTVWAGVLLWL